VTVSQSDIDALLDSERLQRRTKVMFLRNAGATWDKIAAEVGVSEATVRKDYGVVCRDLNNEQPAYVVARHRAVIFDIQRANYPAMMRGDKDAAATILRALEREARLLGLDAPTRILAGISDVEFANEAARLIERINALDPDTLKELERANHTVIDAAVEADPEPAVAPQPHAVGPVVVVDDGAGQPVGDTGTDGDGGASGRPGPADDDPDADWSNI
jgi:predicted DNA-binding transcriptional regulator YafY